MEDESFREPRVFKGREKFTVPRLLEIPADTLLCNGLVGTCGSFHTVCCVGRSSHWRKFFWGGMFGVCITYTCYMLAVFPDRSPERSEKSGGEVCFSSQKGLWQTTLLSILTPMFFFMVTASCKKIFRFFFSNFLTFFRSRGKISLPTMKCGHRLYDSDIINTAVRRTCNKQERMIFNNLLTILQLSYAHDPDSLVDV